MFDRTRERLPVGPRHRRLHGYRCIRNPDPALLDLLGSIPFPDVDPAQWPSRRCHGRGPVGQRGDDHEKKARRRETSRFSAPERSYGMPRASEGRSRGGQRVAAPVGRHLGDTVEVGARRCRSLALCRIPPRWPRSNVFLTTEGLQKLAYNGQPNITSIGIIGMPRQLPEELHQTFDRVSAVSDLVRPLKVAVNSIDRGCFAVDCGGADRVGSVVYLSALGGYVTSRCSRRWHASATRWPGSHYRRWSLRCCGGGDVVLAQCWHHCFAVPVGAYLRFGGRDHRLCSQCCRD